MTTRYRRLIWVPLLLVLLATTLVIGINREVIHDPQMQSSFQAARAYEDIQTQLSFGDRYPGTRGHLLTQIWIQEILQQNEWTVSLQNDDSSDPNIINITGQRSSRSNNWIVLGAHYDTRQYADEDPEDADRTRSVPGANDGASGVAILTELARVLPSNLTCDVTLVFFDAEDQGGINNRNWSEGAEVFVNSLEQKPDAVIIIDMVGDEDLTLYHERNSDAYLNDQVWNIAAELGHTDAFLPQPKYSMVDDHIPFIRAGIPTALIIDFDYAFWHTTSDTIDHVSEHSLQQVGSTIYQWVITNPMCITSVTDDD